MKKLLFILIICIQICLNSFGQRQSTDQEWIKNPATSMYSLEYEKKFKEDLYKQNQKKYVSNVDINKIVNNLQSADEEQRINALRTLALMPEHNQISKIENLLISDPSNTVKMECATTLTIVKSTKSISILIQGLET